MNYEEFREYIKNEIKDRLPEKFSNAEVSIEQITKNNGQRLDGLVVQNTDVNISPNIYLNSFYEDYENGRGMEDILEEIAKIRVEHDVNHDFDASIITDLEKARDHIVCRLVNAKENEELLEQVPHTNVEDLAVTYHVQISGDESGTATVSIHNGIFSAYGISVEDLHDIAMKNMDNISPVKFQNMHDMMSDILISQMIDNLGYSQKEAQCAVEEMLPPDDGNMYVLTNESKLYGASEILNPKVQEMITETVGGDYFILPSSVHETIIIPKTDEMDYKSLADTVGFVNSTELSVEEKLSDFVYEYDHEAKEIMRSDKAEERRAEKKTERQKPNEKQSVKKLLAEKKEEAKEINKNREKGVEKHRDIALA